VVSVAREDAGRMLRWEESFADLEPQLVAVQR
jgi:hypothetical protein